MKTVRSEQIRVAKNFHEMRCIEQIRVKIRIINNGFGEALRVFKLLVFICGYLWLSVVKKAIARAIKKLRVEL